MTDTFANSDWDAALRHCADEPIHLIGKIQCGTALMVVDVVENRFTHLSGNAAKWSGKSMDVLWETLPADLLGAGQLESLQRRAMSWRGRGPRLIEVELPAGRLAPSWIHMRGRNLVIETDLAAEPLDAAWSDPEDWEDAMRDSVERVEACRDLEGKLAAVVAEVRRLGEFDRVMIYRFLPDETGEVVAEEVREDWEPYHGLRYPASDIPAQARALFMQNDIRLIQDVTAAPVSLVARPGVEEPLDLSLCRYRQPSAVHLEYLENMGVEASFVSAIIAEGKLWGLISCHHGEALLLPAERQARLSALTAHLAVDISGIARELRLRNELAGARLANKLIQCVTMTDDWASVLLSMGGELCGIMKAEGMSLRFQENHYSHGLVPAEESVAALAREGQGSGGGLPVSYHHGRGEERHPLLPEEIGGFLVIPLSHFRDDALVFFRKEQTHKIKWAGNPEKRVDRSGGEPRLRPRASFAVWQETVNGGCEPWEADEIALATGIGGTLSDIVITAHYFRQSLESPVTARHRLAHENHPEPVALADENGMVVFLNTAALSDPVLMGLQSLDALAGRLAEAGGPHDATEAVRALAAGAEEVSLPVGSRKLEAGRLIEKGVLVGYCLRLVESSAG